MENEEKKTTRSKSETSKGGVHYDKQSKSWAFRAICVGKDVRKQQIICENHTGPTFGNRAMVTIDVGELKNYLVQLDYLYK